MKNAVERKAKLRMLFVHIKGTGKEVLVRDLVQRGFMIMDIREVAKELGITVYVSRGTHAGYSVVGWKAPRVYTYNNDVVFNGVEANNNVVYKGIIA